MSLGASGGYNSSSSTQTVQDILNSVSQFVQQQQQSTSGGTTATGASSGTTAGTTAGSTAGTTDRTLLPGQAAVVSPLSSLLKNVMANPQQYLAPQLNQAKEAVNSNYTGLPDSLRQQFMGGVGSPAASGKYGTAALQSDLARRGQLAGVDSSFASQAAQLPLSAAGFANNLLGINFGQTATGTTAGSTAGTQQQQQTGSTTNNQDTTGSTTGSSTTNTTENKVTKGSQSGFGVNAGAGGKV